MLPLTLSCCRALADWNGSQKTSSVADPISERLSMPVVVFLLLPLLHKMIIEMQNQRMKAHSKLQAKLASFQSLGQIVLLWALLQWRIEDAERLMC